MPDQTYTAPMKPKPFGTLMDVAVQKRLKAFCERTGQKMYVVVQRAVAAELNEREKV